MILSIFSSPLVSTGIGTKTERASNKPTLTTKISSHPISSGQMSCNEEINVFPVILSGTSTGGQLLESSDLALTLFSSTRPILEYGINNLSIATDLAASILKDELETADQKSLQDLYYETVARIIATDVVSTVAADEDSGSSLQAVRKIVSKKNIQKYMDHVKKGKFVNSLIEHATTEEFCSHSNEIKSGINKEPLEMANFEDSDKTSLNTENILVISDHDIKKTFSETTADNNSGKVSKGTSSKGKKVRGKEVWKKSKRSISLTAKYFKITFNKTNTVAPSQVS